ncbi:MAG: alpha-amylase/4-alpha-glucanotransferase domain-containing protein [Candidatus Muiribacteriota bacterium]
MKNQKTDFIFMLHLHQPFGNFDYVTDKVFKSSYRPFIDELERFPEINFSLHISGPLLIWINKNYPEFIEKLKFLIKREQLEMLGGSYSEAVLPTLQSNIINQQILKYKELFHSIFDKNISLKGFWLTERVWKDELITPLAEAGYEYTFLDFNHIERAGKNPENSIFEVQKNGASLKILPINTFLRYNFPFKSPESILKYLKTQKIAIHADDGEKFGDWPGMYEYLYKNGHLNNLLSELEENNILFLNLTEFIQKQKCQKLYIQENSYDAMNKWSMNPEHLIKIYKENDEETINKNQDYFWTGSFFNFFYKYPESGLIHEKNRIYSDIFRHDKDVFTQLLQSQCCCGYWHGVFGGIYLPHLRDAINLGNIYAEEKLPDGVNNIEKFTVLKNSNMALTINQKGGGISHLNVFKDKKNIFNSLSRKPEFYHKDIAEPVYYDYYQRNNFIEHITRKIADPDSYLKNKYGEQSKIWEKNFNLRCKEHNIIELSGQDKALLNDKIVNIKINKKFILKNNQLTVEYNFENTEDFGEYFAVCELNFHNVYGDEIQNFNTDFFELKADFFPDIKVTLSENVKCFLVPVETFSIYHQKNETIKQSYTALVHIPIKNKKFQIKLNIGGRSVDFS